MTLDARADRAWLDLRDRAEYDALRSRLHEKMLAAIGEFPERTPLNARTVSKVEKGSYVVEKVLFESMPGLYVTANLFLPKSGPAATPCPAVVLSCGHSYYGKDCDTYLRACVLLAERGVAAFMFDPYEQGERVQYPRFGSTVAHNIIGLKAMLLGWSMPMLRIWDAMRAVDYVASRAEIAADRIGFMGQSGGGTMTALMTAADGRLKATAPSGYLTNFRFLMKCAGPQDAEQNIFGQLAFGLNHTGYVLLPDTKVCVTGRYLDFFPMGGTCELMRVVDEVAGMLGEKEHYAMNFAPGPHGWTESTMTASADWMCAWLKGEKDKLPLDMAHYRTLDVGLKPSAGDFGLGEAERGVTPERDVMKLPGARDIHAILRDRLAAAVAKRRALSTAERSALVRKRAGVRLPAERKMTVKELGERKSGAVVAHEVAFVNPDGLTLPALVFAPPAERPGAAPVLLVGSKGRKEFVGEVQAALTAGRTAVVVDVFACGEIGAPMCVNGTPTSFYGATDTPEEGVAVMLYLLGESMVGRRASDILFVADWMKRKFGAAPSVVARDTVAVAAAHALAADPSLIASVEVKAAPASWTEFLTRPGDPEQYRYASCVNGALNDYDWTELLPKTAPAAPERPELVVGIVSDVHMNLTDKSKLYENRFRKALKFFDGQKCDAVLGCGDWIEFGWHDWFRRLGECWFETFPSGRRSDGEPIEKCFIFGDHEIENFWNPGITRAFSRDYILAHDIPTYGRGKIYEEVLKEPWAPVMRKTVKGYDFVMAHFTMREGPNGELARWGESIPGLAAFFRTNSFDRSKPFFYAQHRPPKGTCISPFVSVADNGESTKILSDFPNCLAFCGHKHRSATSEHSLWQGDFTCIEVPAMQGVCTDAGHENGWASCDGYGPGDPPKQMKRLNFAPDGGQCLLAKVYRDRLVIERWNAVFFEKCAEDWVIPLPLTEARPAAFENRAKAAKPVAFAKDAAICVAYRKGPDRTGAVGDQYVVTFPQAKGDAAHSRGHDYLVTARVTKHWWSRVSCEKWVYSPKCCLPEKRDTNDVVCVFSKAEVPGPYESVTFTVTPYNAFHQAGEPISTQPLAQRDLANLAIGMPAAELDRGGVTFDDTFAVSPGQPGLVTFAWPASADAAFAGSDLTCRVTLPKGVAYAASSAALSGSVRTEPQPDGSTVTTFRTAPQPVIVPGRPCCSRCGLLVCGAKDLRPGTTAGEGRVEIFEGGRKISEMRLVFSVVAPIAKVTKPVRYFNGLDFAEMTPIAFADRKDRLDYARYMANCGADALIAESCGLADDKLFREAGFAHILPRQADAGPAGQNAGIVRPEALGMQLDSCFFNRRPSATPGSFPLGCDARCWTAYADATSRAARYEYYVLDGNEASADATCCVSAGTGDLQTRAFELDGRRIVAVLNFCEKGEAFFDLSVRVPDGAYRVIDENGVLYAKDDVCDTWTAAELRAGVLLQVGAMRTKVFEVHPKSWSVSPTSVMTRDRLKALRDVGETGR